MPLANDPVSTLAIVAATLILLALLTPPRRRRRARRSAGLLAGWLWSRRLDRDSPSRRAGRAGERKVAKALAKAGFPALHDLYLPIGGDDVTQVDHAVLAGGVIVVLETKHMAGFVAGRASQPDWTQVLRGRRRRFRNPCAQNEVHVEAVRRACRDEAPVTGLVVFSASAHLRLRPPEAAARLSELVDRLRDVAARHPRSRRSDRAWARLETSAHAIPLDVARKRHAATLARSRGL